MEKVINCQHCQERIIGGAIQIFLNKETVSENKFNDLIIRNLERLIIITVLIIV